MSTGNRPPGLSETKKEEYKRLQRVVLEKDQAYHEAIDEIHAALQQMESANRRLAKAKLALSKATVEKGDADETKETWSRRNVTHSVHRKALEELDDELQG